MITTPEEAFRLMQRHLKEWRPKEYAELKRIGHLLPVTLRAAKKVQTGIRNLLDSGTPYHEAQEIMLKRYILKAPEPEMIAEMEK